MKKLRKFGRPMEEVRPLSLRQCNQVNVASPRADDNRRGKGLMVRIFFFFDNRPSHGDFVGTYWRAPKRPGLSINNDSVRKGAKCVYVNAD